MFGMRRREFIGLLGGAAAAWPVAARAQQGERVRRIGVLMNDAATEAVSQSYVAEFVQRLRQLGWVEGRNIRIDVRWNAGDAALARIYAAQLIGLMPDVILAASTTNLRVVQQATNSVPVVFVRVSDPVEQGFIASLTKPGGNLTGFSTYEFSVGGKWVDLLKEFAPSLTLVAVMFNPDTAPQSKFFMRSVEATGPSHGVQAIATPVRTTIEIETALQNFSREPNGGLILPTDTFTRLRSKRSRSWRNAIACHRFPPTLISPKMAASCIMARSSTCPTNSDRRRATSIASSGARNPATCPSSKRTSTPWFSISRPPRRWGSPYRFRYRVSPMS
jgi:putative ABC transport system substrate-binding protein